MSRQGRGVFLGSLLKLPSLGMVRLRLAAVHAWRIVRPTYPRYVLQAHTVSVRDNLQLEGIVRLALCDVKHPFSKGHVGRSCVSDEVLCTVKARWIVKNEQWRRTGIAEGCP